MNPAGRLAVDGAGGRLVEIAVSAPADRRGCGRAHHQRATMTTASAAASSRGYTKPS
ncbi:MAG: hypothetical protein ACKOTE_08975 [Opitutaceae bacterium]